MSKKNKQDREEVPEFHEAEGLTLKEFPNKAFSMYPVKAGTSTQYVLVEIGFDPETGDVGFVKELARDIKEDIIDKLKGQVADNFFRSE